MPETEAPGRRLQGYLVQFIVGPEIMPLPLSFPNDLTALATAVGIALEYMPRVHGFHLHRYKDEEGKELEYVASMPLMEALASKEVGEAFRAALGRQALASAVPVVGAGSQGLKELLEDARKRGLVQ